MDSREKTVKRRALVRISGNPRLEAAVSASAFEFQARQQFGRQWRQMLAAGKRPNGARIVPTSVVSALIRAKRSVKK